MASIGSLSSSTSSLVSGGGGLHGYGGLASGLDRDTLIESMTYGTRAKIAKQQQKKQTYQWKQDAYRSVTDKLVALSSKYMDYTNPTSNLSNSSLFSRTNIVANGKNASKVSVTASGSNAADSLTILGVKQMAKNASATSSSPVSDSKLTTGDINFAEETVSVFQDQSLKIKVDGTTYTVNIGEIADPTDQAGVIEQLNKALANVKVGEKGNLGQYVKFGASGDGIGLAKTPEYEGKVVLTGGSDKLFESFGIQKKDDGTNEEWVIGSSFDNISTKNGISEEVSFKDRIAGQSLTFSYNGKQITIKMPDASKLADPTDPDAEEKNKKAVLTALQDGFDKAVGKGRVKVDTSGDKFTFETTLPDGGADKTSILTLDYGSSGMVGEHRAFHVLAGENNKLNLNAKLKDSGLLAGAIPAVPTTMDINGAKIEITADDTINSIMDKINKNTDAGVKISYLQNSGKFTIASTVEGASGKLGLDETAKKLFGVTDADIEAGKGQDAIVTVQYAGSSEQINLVRSSNTFTQDGLNITVKGEFGVYENKAGVSAADDKIDIKANAEAGNEITFESKANVDSLLTNIKDMVNAYNEIVDLVNSLVSTKPDRDYAPLTDDQKEEMSEEQIEKWEKKAKEGILFGDDLLRNLSSDLRFVAGGSLMNQLEAIGISEVTGYQSNGKLTIDENKLKNALESEPDKVARLFTDTKTGLMTNMKKVTDSYAKTWGTKGSLIARAGSEAAAMSLTDNELYTSMKDIDDIIKQLQTRLKSEQDRYIAQFTRLETVIAQMNSQSSYLSSMSGGY